jgi:histone H3/H4
MNIEVIDSSGTLFTGDDVNCHHSSRITVKSEDMNLILTGFYLSA